MQHKTILGVEWTARRIQSVVGVVVVVLLYMTGFLWPLLRFVISFAALCALVATLILMYKSVKPHLTREAEAKYRPRLEFGLPLISGAATLFLFLLLPIIPEDAELPSTPDPVIVAIPPSVVDVVDVRKRDATKAYWDAYCKLNGEFASRLRRPAPKTPQEMLHYLEESDKIVFDFLSRSSALNTDNVDRDVIVFVSKDQPLGAEARHHLADGRLHLARLISHNESSQGWMAYFNYSAEGLLGKQSSLDQAMATASDLEKEFIAAMQRFEGTEEKVGGMVEAEIKLRHTMHERYGLSLPALVESAPQE